MLLITGLHVVLYASGLLLIGTKSWLWLLGIFQRHNFAPSGLKFNRPETVKLDIKKVKKRKKYQKTRWWPSVRNTMLFYYSFITVGVEMRKRTLWEAEQGRQHSGSQWVLQAGGAAGGNTEDSEKRLGRPLNRKTTKLSHDILNLHPALSDAWARASEPSQESCQESDRRRRVWPLNSSSFICQEAKIQDAAPSTGQTRSISSLWPDHLQFWSESSFLICSLWPLKQVLLKLKVLNWHGVPSSSLKAEGQREDSLTWHRERWAPGCWEQWCSPRNLGILGRRAQSLLHHRGTRKNCQLELPSKHGRWQDPQRARWEQQRSERHTVVRFNSKDTFPIPCIVQMLIYFTQYFTCVW